MPKAERKSKGDEEEDVPIHGATNEKEAKHIQQQSRWTITVQMGVRINNKMRDANKKRN